MRPSRTSPIIFRVRKWCSSRVPTNEGWKLSGNAKLSPVGQLRYAYRRPDGLADETGYARVLVSPGMELERGKLRLYADVAVPLYTNARDNQLFAKRSSGDEADDSMATHQYPRAGGDDCRRGHRRGVRCRRERPAHGAADHRPLRGLPRRRGGVAQDPNEGLDRPHRVRAGWHFEDAFPHDVPAAQRDAAGLDGPLFDPTAKGIKVALKGMDSVAGHRAYHLKITLPSGQLRDDWIDAQSFLELRYDRETHSVAGATGVASVYLRNYQSFEGLVIPLTIETGRRSRSTRRSATASLPGLRCRSSTMQVS